MKYCFNYNKDTEHMKYINEADEWTIVYNKRDNTLLEFLDLHKDKRINIYFTEKDLVSKDFLEELSKKYNNIYLKLNMKYYYNKIIKYNCKFFFDTLIKDWDTLIGLLEYGVTDVYIVENMCFELNKVAEIAHKYNVNIRVFPNVAQSSFTEIEPLKKFFIRPEDIDVYSNYVDTIEFFEVDKSLDTYYEIYAIDKKWFGKLNEIIKDFNSEIDNKYIIPRFVEKRIKCGKSCFKGSSCNRCNVIENLAGTLEESKLVITQK